MAKYIYRKVYLSLFVLFCISTWGQGLLFAGNNYVFRTFSPEGGFYYDGVKDIAQDSEGFIWVLMDENLYRFDGYEYKSYYSHFTNFDKSIRWTLNNQAVDSRGRLYVSTNNGLFRYDREQDGFTLISNLRSDMIRMDATDNIWMFTYDSWSILDGQTREAFTPRNDKDSTLSLRSLFCVYENDVYVLTLSSTVLRYNPSMREFNACFPLPTGFYANQIFISKGKLWLLSDERCSLLKIDLATSLVEDRITMPGQWVSKALYMDKNGLAWVGTTKGLYIVDPATKEINHYTHVEADEYSLPNSSIWAIKEDNLKNVWIGTFSGGLAYANPDEKMAFKSYFPKPQGLNHAPVSGFAEDDKHIWISTEGGGLNRMNKATGEFAYYTHDPQTNGLASNNIKSLTLDKYKRLWISTFNGGMNALDIERNKFRNYTANPQDSNSLYSNSLRKITLEADSGLWIIYQHNKQILSYYSFEKERFRHFEFGDKNDRYYIFDILRGRNNRLWILSDRKLYMMDLTDYSIRDVSLDDSLYLYGRSLCQDASGNIWIGTMGNGLIRYDPETKEHAVFHEIYHKGMNTIYSMLYDDNGHLWLGTDNGIVLYDPANNQFRKFDREDGGQGRGYYLLSCMKAMNGDLYFGGTNGFTIIDTKQVNENTYRPHVIISDFFVDNVRSRISLDEAITLNYDQSNFMIKFASDNYLIPEKTYYKYRLRGYDDRWIVTDASNRLAIYSKVPPGSYLFEVLAANNDGSWSETATVLKIVRKPAPWLSEWAYLLYASLLFAMACFFLRSYHKQKKLQLQLYKDELEKNKREEIHQSQLRFFTNISHDFRTPLTLILGVLSKLKPEGVKEYYYSILHNNAHRLLNLINELMEFRTLENGKMNLHVEPVDANQLVGNLAQDFKEYALQRNIDFRVKCDPLLPSSLWIDRQIAEKIVMNLLNNAFKYTKEKGSISIETYGNEAGFKSAYSENFLVGNAVEYNGYFLIVVHDTGIGISKESIASVFERFYKVDTMNVNSHLGTGIGLALVRSLVLLHKGKIAIYSEKDKGSDFVVYLPLDPGVYKEEELLALQADKGVYSPSMETTADELALDEKNDIFLRNKKRILVVEDNQELRGLIVDYLSDHYEVVGAEDGVEGTEILHKLEVDLIISDIMMPRKDGITFCREVKGNLETSHIPVILLTAKTGMDNKIEGVGAKADFYFEKPVDFNYLLVSIGNLFERQSKLKEYYAKNYYVESPELTANEQDNKFLQRFIEILDECIDQPKLDVNYIATELSMSRSKLYLKIKALTDKSIIEFILNYKLKKAARIIIEENVSMRQVMERIGIESQSYFTNAFKKEFGETPTVFATKHKHNKDSRP
jgi:signal transduction histidine kinase/ligand-binding sensor domain-containing protein/DNA-binding response OmpR family regulator